MFSKDVSSNDKDLLRLSLKSRVSAIGAALKPKRNAQHQSAIMPSALQSECSTLVDFVVEDALVKDDDELDFETEDYMLDADNSAWANGKFTVSSALKKQKRTHSTQHVLVPFPFPETQPLSTENSAWGTTRRGASQPTTKSRTHLFSSSRPACGTSGVEPEYLDPEDRAWM